ncbi:hypothetical protein C1H46_014487 [Malus baccata]|uniref:Uncharacterized protein n=1 Tax=Malus baccata TaxID=106549 RepID=A0A540MM86_MALBA|nr:hypothetical protein C1H46_014487 [Malus baccata]
MEVQRRWTTAAVIEEFSHRKASSLRFRYVEFLKFPFIWAFSLIFAFIWAFTYSEAKGISGRCRGTVVHN